MGGDISYNFINMCIDNYVIYYCYILVNATALGDQRQVLHRQFCISLSWLRLHVVR